MKSPNRRKLMGPFTHRAATGRERWRQGTIGGLTPTCFGGLLLAGCGGTSDKQTTGVGDEFASKAVAVCAAALADKHTWQPFPVADFDRADPDASRVPEVSTWLAEQVGPTFDMWLSGLQALGTPPSAQAEW